MTMLSDTDAQLERLAATCRASHPDSENGSAEPASTCEDGPSWRYNGGTVGCSEFAMGQMFNHLCVSTIVRSTGGWRESEPLSTTTRD
eukprot:COSAG05_NODE_2342_length_3204_cov_5.613205_3_plen_88_part_00